MAELSWRHAERRNVHGHPSTTVKRTGLKVAKFLVEVSNIARGGSDPVQITGSNR